MTQLLSLEFEKAFGGKAVSAYFCPGRINLIGEHLDYNGGWVLPAAIGLGTYLLLAPNTDGVFRFRSLNLKQQLDISNITDYLRAGSDWFNYPAGILKAFITDGHQLPGHDFLFYGDIPIGTGLSSSASIEVITAFALNYLLGEPYSQLELVKLAQRVENEFIGVNCGIMDQFAVTFGEKDKAVMLNCHTLEFSKVPFRLDEQVLVIINTNKPRKLSGSKYNERVTECRQALSLLAPLSGASCLCDITPEMFYEFKGAITDKKIRNRARHVVEENDRVRRAARAMASDDIAIFGQLMFDSHDSLKTLYEVTGVELDTIVDFCRQYKNAMGARMTGAGFGGCAIALVRRDDITAFNKGLTAYYSSKIGYNPEIYSTDIHNGVQLLK